MSAGQALPHCASFKLNRLFRYSVVNISLTFALGALYYADPFHFWHHALSEIGATITLVGTPNLTSAVIIIIGMFINGRLLLETARVYRGCPRILHARTKSGLLYAASLGSFISIFPNNLFHTLHSVGSALLIGGLFLMDLVILRESFSSLQPVGAFLITGILTASVLSYAVAFFADLPVKQAVQKVCIINLLLVFYERSCDFHHLADPEAKPFPS